MKIGLLGDTHGTSSWMEFALNEFYRRGVTTIVQVGDFGIWPGRKDFLDSTNRWLNMFDMRMFVTPGNHEDYSQIRNYVELPTGLLKVRDRIYIHPRGHRWEWEGVSFVSLGGAASVDRTYRLRKSLGWWEEEAISDEDVARTAEGGYADVMITHEAPFGVQEIARRTESNPHGFMLHDLQYAHEVRSQLDKAFRAVSPKILIHGHYHFPVSEMLGDSYIMGLSKDYSNFSLGELNIPNLRTSLWDIRDVYDAHASRLKRGHSTV